LKGGLSKVQTITPLSKAGKGGTNTALMILGFVAVVGLLVWIAMGVQQRAVPGPVTEEGVPISVATAGCPTDLVTTATISVENVLNTTGAETYNTTMYIFSKDGEVQSITDTTAGTASLTCGQSYTGKIISTDGAAGDSSEILGTTSGKVTDGNVEFKASSRALTLSLETNQRGVPEVRARDIVNDAFMYDTSDVTNLDYETTDGVIFSSTTDNATGTAVGSGSELHVTQYVRANVDDNDFNDRGIYVLIDAASNVWNIPTVKIDGKVASEASGMLNSDEKIAYNDYEFVYFIPADREVTKNKEVAVDLSIFALGGVDPTGANNVSVDYAVIGQYESTQKTNVIKVGAVKDDSSKTQVYTLHDTVIWTA